MRIHRSTRGSGSPDTRSLPLPARRPACTMRWDRSSAKGGSLDCIDQFPDFEPERHYKLTVSDTGLTTTERNAGHAKGPDDVELDV
jgi:hypothetical protein